MSDAPLPPSRRTVTILFTDVVGSTELAEALDPEVLRPALGAYFAACRTAIERHGGTVEKYIGDAVMAVFGIPAVHEDDALRAVRAAVDLASAVEAVADAWETILGARLRIRTGIQTGPVLAGGGAPGEPVATGDAVNTAARLQGMGGPGDIVLGEGTLRLLRGAVELQVLPPVALKGKARLVEAARLVSLTRELRPGQGDAPAVLVGRDAELSGLADALGQVIRSRQPRAMVIVGEPGIGKSTLIMRFLADQALVVRTARARIAPYGEATYAPLDGLLRDLSGAPPGAEAVAVLDRFRTLLVGTPSAAEIEGNLASLLGLRPNPVRHEEIAWAVRSVILAVASESPLLLVIEDLHWAQAGLLRMITDLRTCLGAPVLLLVTTRPDERWWLDDGIGWDFMDLASLDGAAATAVLESSLGGPAERRLGERLGTLGRGNPLFLEQLVVTLRDEGRIVLRGGTWEATDALLSVNVPASVEALVAARVDRLDPAARSLLERIAVGGNELEVSVAEAIGDVIADELVGRLVDAHFLIHRATDTLAYRHALVRDAVYSGIVKRRRAELHLAIADRIEAVGSHADTVANVRLGYHVEAAVVDRRALRIGGHETDLLAIRAAGHLAAAGRHAYSAADMPAAADLLGRAVDLLPTEDAVRAALLPDLGKARLETGDERALATLDEALERTAQAGLTREHAHARLHRYVAGIWMERSLSGVEERVPLLTIASQLESEGDLRGAALAWSAVAEIGWYTDDTAAARTATETAGRLAKEAGDLWGWRESLALSAGDPWNERPAADSVDRLDQVLRLAEQHPMVSARVLPELGFAVAVQGDLAQGRAMAMRGLDLARQIGLRVWEIEVASAVAYLEVRVGSAEEAVRLAGGACALARSVGDRAHLAGSAGVLAMAYAALAHDEEARTWASVCHEHRPSDTSQTELYWRLSMVGVELRAGSVEVAAALARWAMSLLRQRDGDLRAMAEQALAAVEDASGRPQEAAVLRRAARARYERLGYTALVATVQA